MPAAFAFLSSKFHFEGSCTAKPIAGQLCFTGNALTENKGVLKKTPEETSFIATGKVGCKCGIENIFDRNSFVPLGPKIFNSSFRPISPMLCVKPNKPRKWSACKWERKMALIPKPTPYLSSCTCAASGQSNKNTPPYLNAKPAGSVSLVGRDPQLPKTTKRKISSTQPGSLIKLH